MSDHTAFGDWLAICNLKARYCRLLDSKQWDEFARLLVEDFKLDVTEASNGKVPIRRGRDEAMTIIRSSIEHAKTAHHVHSPEIEVNGDTARGVWAMRDRVIWSADRPALSGFGHYHETYRNVGREWKIQSSRLTRLIVEMNAPMSGSIS